MDEQSLNPKAGMSKQRRWQLKQIAKGLCQICGQKSDYGTRCLVCQEKDNNRRKLRYKKWTPGGRRRPPLYAREK